MSWGIGVRQGRPIALFSILLTLLLVAPVVSAQTRGFTTPFVVGFTRGDDWEPWVEVDAFGNVYVAWAHFGEVPGCETCSDPAAMIQVSRDGGDTFGPPRPLNPAPVDYQIDLQVEANSAGVVWVAYLQDKDTVVQRTDDFGETWSAPVRANVGIKESWTDKVGLAVQDDSVYVAFSIAQRYYVSYSHDGGRSFTAVQLNKRSSDTGWTLTSGGVVDSRGNVYFSWVGVHQSGNALGPQEVFLTKSSDGGRSWSTITIAEDLPPGPDCSEWSCGWDFWGPQMVVHVDASDTVYVAYNAGLVDQGPPYVWFQASRDGGNTWTDRKVVHADGLSEAYHLFPAIVGGARGEVHVSWMDNRFGRFNVFYRTSSDFGATFGPEVKVNRNLGFRYQSDAGFEFTYGDYYGITRDARGRIHIAWGEGPDYIGPGNVFYSHN
jgi:photosystem II stability/assembly factor-like uncharacterized protein